jgi:hypothetical protein
VPEIQPRHCVERFELPIQFLCQSNHELVCAKLSRWVDVVVITQSFVHEVPVVEVATSSLTLEVWSQRLDGGFGEFVELGISSLEVLSPFRCPAPSQKADENPEAYIHPGCVVL